MMMDDYKSGADALAWFKSSRRSPNVAGLTAPGSSVVRRENVAGEPARASAHALRLAPVQLAWKQKRPTELFTNSPLCAVATGRT